MSLRNKRKQAYEEGWEKTLVELLKDGPKTHKELLREIDCSSSTLYNWLRFFEAKGLIKVRYEGREKIIELKRTAIECAGEDSQ